MNMLKAAQETVEKVREHKSAKRWIGANRHPYDQSSLSLDHMEKMLETMESANFSVGKMGRWLGWIQAAAVAGSEYGSITLETVKQINMRNSVDDHAPDPINKSMVLPESIPTGPKVELDLALRAFGVKADDINWQSDVERAALFAVWAMMQRELNDAWSHEMKAEAEGLAEMAANQCIFTDGTGLVGDEHGNLVCSKDKQLRDTSDRIAELEGELRLAWHIGRASYAPVEVLRDETRTEREWSEAKRSIQRSRQNTGEE